MPGAPVDLREPAKARPARARRRRAGPKARNPGAYEEGMKKLLGGDPAGAADHFGAMMLDDPGDPDGHSGAGSVLMLGGSAEKALEFFKRALSLGDGRASTRLGMGGAYKTLGMDEESLMCYRDALSLRPDSLLVNASMAYVYICGNMYARALDRANAALKYDPGFVEAKTLQGIALINAGSPKGGADIVEKAGREAPESGSAALGQAYLQLADRTEVVALWLLDELPGGEPQDPGGHYARGAALSEAQDHAGAHEQYLAAGRAEPTAKTHAAVAASFIRLHGGDPDAAWRAEAFKLVERAIGIDPGYLYEHFARDGLLET